MAIGQFTIIGHIATIRAPEGGTAVISVQANNEDTLEVVLAGKVLEVYSQLKKDDLVYVHGRLRTDRHLVATSPKNLVMLFANHLSIIQASS